MEIEHRPFLSSKSEYEDENNDVIELQPRRRSSSSDQDCVEIGFDDAFQKAGLFGLFQIRLFVLVLLYQPVAVFHILAITFIGLVPEWTCSEFNISASEVNSTGIEDDMCLLYEKEDITCTPDYKDRFYSLTQEWDLICDEAYKISLTQSGLFVGFLFGSYILGSLADSIGRRRVVIGYLIALTGVQILTALSPSYYVFAICRLLVGFLVAGGLSAYVLVCEVIGPKQRSLLASATAIAFGLGFSFLSLAAYLIHHWRGIVILSAVLTLAVILFYKYIPESPRWLLVNGREIEARKALINIAKTNGRSLPPDFTLKGPVKSKSMSVGFIDLMKHRVMRNRTLLLMLAWFTNCLVYYGLSLGVGNFTSNLYIGFTLSGLVEIPSNILALITLEKIGRKWSNFGFLTLGGGACIACACVQILNIDSSGTIKLLLLLLGKFSIAASFSVIYTYTPELLPTDVRTLGMGVANVTARFGGIISPLVILLDSSAPGLPMLIMGVIGIVTSVLCLYLPETLNASLPNTIAEIKK